MGNTIRNLVSGGAGFLGSHLIDQLMKLEEEVICLDNLNTGRKTNLLKWLDNKNFKFVNHDITEPINFKIDKIWHLGCPASPKDYSIDPIKTSKTNILGTINMLELAKSSNAKLIFTSTSEIYGEPKVHPQPETYKGLVNNISSKSCYVEGKRMAESLCFDYKRVHGCDVKIARIFNTYGPRMLINDGRVISNFIVQSLKKQPLTIYGSGKQTRSFCFVDDLIEGLVLLMNSEIMSPVNLGNPFEISILETAKIITSKIGSKNEFIYKGLPEDDCSKRKPLIEVAKQKLGWQPKVNFDAGINRTIDYFRKELKMI